MLDYIYLLFIITYIIKHHKVVEEGWPHCQEYNVLKPSLYCSFQVYKIRVELIIFKVPSYFKILSFWFPHPFTWWFNWTNSILASLSPNSPPPIPSWFICSQYCWRILGGSHILFTFIRISYFPPQRSLVNKKNYNIPTSPPYRNDNLSHWYS